MVPLRFTAESLGASVEWDDINRTVNIKTGKGEQGTASVQEFSLQGISIGDPVQKVIEKLGKPEREDLSEYGFSWYIYNKDYHSYIQVGVQNERVVGLYTNASNWVSKNGFQVGTKQQSIRSVLGDHLTSIRRGETVYLLDDGKNEVYLLDNNYATIFYDTINDSTVTAVQLIQKDIEASYKPILDQYCDELRESYERELFDLANTVRVRFGKTPFKPDEAISALARSDSTDMVERDFFSHKNPDGKDPFERMKDEGIAYSEAAQNIACGQTSAIFAHEALMNSQGHRDNILGSYTRFGSGVALGGKMSVYYTQYIYTPQ